MSSQGGSSGGPPPGKSGAPPPGGGGTSKSSLRAIRNAAEKQRRDRINGLISELATIVPLVSESRKKLDKTSILRLSAAYLRLEKCSLSLYNPPNSGSSSGECSSWYNSSSGSGTSDSESVVQKALRRNSGSSTSGAWMDDDTKSEMGSIISAVMGDTGRGPSMGAIQMASGKSVDLYQIVDSVNGFVIVLTTTGKIVLVTHTVERFLGHLDIDLIGNNLSSFVHPADHQHVLAQMMDAYKRVERTGEHMSERISVRCRLRERSQPRSEVITYQMVQISGHFILSRPPAQDEDITESTGNLSGNTLSSQQHRATNFSSSTSASSQQLQLLPPPAPSAQPVTQQGTKRSADDMEAESHNEGLDGSCSSPSQKRSALTNRSDVMDNNDSSARAPQGSASAASSSPTHQLKGPKNVWDVDVSGAKISSDSAEQLQRKRSASGQVVGGGAPSDAQLATRKAQHLTNPAIVPAAAQQPNNQQQESQFEYLFKGFVQVIETNPMAELNLTDADLDEYVTRMTLDGTLLFTDHRISLILGLSPEEVIGRSAYDYIKADDHTISLFAHRLMLSNANGTGIIVHRLKNRSGDTVYIQSSGCLQYDRSTGQVDHFVCVARVLHTEEGDRERQKFVQRFTPHIHDSTPAALYESLQIVIGPQKCSRRYIATSAPIMVAGPSTFSNTPPPSSLLQGLPALGPDERVGLPCGIQAARPHLPIAGQPPAGIINAALSSSTLNRLPIQQQQQLINSSISSIPLVPVPVPQQQLPPQTIQLAPQQLAQLQAAQPHLQHQLQQQQILPQAGASSLDSPDVEVIDVKPSLAMLQQQLLLAQQRQQQSATSANPTGSHPQTQPSPNQGGGSPTNHNSPPPPPGAPQPGLVFQLQSVSMSGADTTGSNPDEVRMQNTRITYQPPTGSISSVQNAAMADHLRADINTILQGPIYMQHAAARGLQPYHIPTPQDPFKAPLPGLTQGQVLQPPPQQQQPSLQAQPVANNQITFLQPDQQQQQQAVPQQIQFQIQAVPGQQAGTTQLTLVASSATQQQQSQQPVTVVGPAGQSQAHQFITTAGGGNQPTQLILQAAPNQQISTVSPNSYQIQISTPQQQPAQMVAGSGGQVIQLVSGGGAQPQSQPQPTPPQQPQDQASAQQAANQATNPHSQQAVLSNQQTFTIIPQPHNHQQHQQQPSSNLVNITTNESDNHKVVMITANHHDSDQSSKTTTNSSSGATIVMKNNQQQHQSALHNSGGVAIKQHLSVPCKTITTPTMCESILINNNNQQQNSVNDMNNFNSMFSGDLPMDLLGDAMGAADLGNLGDFDNGLYLDDATQAQLAGSLFNDSNDAHQHHHPDLTNQQTEAGMMTSGQQQNASQQNNNPNKVNSQHHHLVNSQHGQNLQALVDEQQIDLYHNF